MLELFKEIIATSRRNRLRTALTGFAVAWGIFMLIFLLGAGNGLINAQLHQTDQFLASSMLMGGRSTSKPYRGLARVRPIRLDRRDVATLSATFASTIDDMVPQTSFGGQTLSYSGKYFTSTTLSGVCPAELKINKREIVCGRFINDIDVREKRKSLVISDKHAREFAPTPELTVGQWVRLGQTAYRVVGVYKSDADRQDNTVFAPLTTATAVNNSYPYYHSLGFSFHGPSTVEENDAFERRITESVNLNHEAAPDDSNTLWMWNRLKGNIQMFQGIAMIRIALWIVGLFTLLSGVVGVSNIMLITVKERTREFGIRKAIGAKPWDILRLIITESVIITTFFGYIGMVCGLIGCELLDATIGRTTIDTGLFHATMFLNPTVGLDVCVEATAVIIIAGTVAGLIPSLKAARVRPIVALSEN